jgi:hypothetical protein
MSAPFVVGLLAWTSLLLVSQLAATTLRLHVVDGQGVPIAQLALRVEDADGQVYDAITNADGAAVVGPLAGTQCFLHQATLADGRALQVEPTTASDGLRLGLIPHQERTVRLIADGGLLFLDPEELFPADDSAEAAPDGAPLPASARSLAFPPAPSPRPSNGAAAESGAGAASSTSLSGASTGAPPRALIGGLVAVAASTIVVLMSIIVVRRHE